MNPLYRIPTNDPRVQSSVAFIKGHLPCTVEYFDGYAEGPYSVESHLVTFRNGTREYVAIAGLLAFYPSISLLEMRTIGFGN